METSSKRLFKSRLDAKQDIWRAIPALMGDGNGNIEVPNQPNYVYIRIGDGDLGQAFNNRCQLRDNLAIYVGYDPVTDPDRRIFQVLTVRMADYAGAGNVTVPNVGQHHTTHEFGGGDDVYVDWRRLMGLRVGRPALFVVTVDPGYIFRSGAWMIIPSTTVDLTVTHAALVGSEAQYVLISLSDAGVVTATAGAVKGGLTLLTIADVPVPPVGHIPLAAVRLYTAQTSIGDTPSAPDIIDLRFPTTFASGGSNVFGAGTANEFAYWLAADTLTSSSEVARQALIALMATKAATALALATTTMGIYSNTSVAAAVAQAGNLRSIDSHMTIGGAGDYTGSLMGILGLCSVQGTGTLSLLHNIDLRLELTAAGTVTSAAAIVATLDAGATGTITTGYGVNIAAPSGSIGTFYGVYIGSLAAATAKWAFYAVGDKITTKLAAAAGIELDPNAATGNFTLSLSPANLTANRRVTFGDVTGIAALGAGTATVATANDVTVASHTHAITSSANPGAAASILATDASGNLSLSGTFTSSGTNYINQPYGSFSSTVNQTVAVINTAYAVAFNTDDIKSGVTHDVAINNSRIIIEEYGVYLITVSAVVDQAIGTGGHINVWLAVDGAAVANSNTKLELAGNIETTLAVNFIYDFSSAYSFGPSTPFFEIMYCSDNTSVRMLATAAAAPAPACPSIICTVNKISA